MRHFASLVIFARGVVASCSWSDAPAEDEVCPERAVVPGGGLSRVYLLVLGGLKYGMTGGGAMIGGGPPIGGRGSGTTRRGLSNISDAAE